MTNALFHGTHGLQAVVATAQANFTVAGYLAQQLNLIGHVGPNPTLDQMKALGKAYQFFSAIWNETSFTVGNTTVDFSKIKGLDPAALAKLKTDFTGLLKSYNNVSLPQSDGSNVQLKDEHNHPVSLYDLVTGRPDDPNFSISFDYKNDYSNKQVSWYDGDMDHDVHHNDDGAWYHAGVYNSDSGSLDPSKMPPGFSCDYESRTGACHHSSQTDFHVKIDPNAVASGDDSNIGVTKGESGWQWLQEHCDVTASDSKAAGGYLDAFDKDYSSAFC